MNEVEPSLPPRGGLVEIREGTCAVDHVRKISLLVYKCCSCLNCGVDAQFMAAVETILVLQSCIYIVAIDNPKLKGHFEEQRLKEDEIIVEPRMVLSRIN